MFKLDEEELREAVEVLRRLIQFDTTNPPGNERPAAQWLAGVLAEEGIESELVEPVWGRACLVARLKGSGAKRPLMLSSHLDVVPAIDADGWTHSPFAATEADGFVWGRGAVDMKGMAAMAVAVMRLVKRKGIALERDLIFAAVADEEEGCAMGSEYLVEHRPELVDAEFVLNEVGGFLQEVEGRRIYPVQVAEKGIAALRVRVTGAPGHGSLPALGSCLEKLGKGLESLAKVRLPIHVTDSTKAFLDGVGAEMKGPIRFVMPMLAWPGVGGFIMDWLVRDLEQKTSLQAVLCNVANPTMVRAGEKINVIPSEAVFEIDGRLLPGQTGADLVREVGALLGEGFEIEILRESPAAVFSEKTLLFEAMRAAIAARDPEGAVVPYLMPGFTDSRNWGKLGATCYGFYPLQIPEGVVFSKLFHGVDERIPVEGFRFGIETLFDLVEGFVGTNSRSD